MSFAFIKPRTAENIQNKLNSFHPDIKFTYEYENDNTISFLDVRITRAAGGNLETSVYRKPTHIDICLHWNAHSPTTWKTATVKSLVKRAFSVSSTEAALDSELSRLRRVFTTINNYPLKVVNNIIESERRDATPGDGTDQRDQPANQPPEKEAITITIPYAGQKGEQLIRKMKTNIKDSNLKCL